MALVPIVRAARCAPLGGDSGKWLPKCGAQSSKNKTITHFYQRNPIQVSETFIAGHNKWSKVKRIKGAIDAKRGKLFSKLAKEIAVAAKLGGDSVASFGVPRNDDKFESGKFAP